MILEKNGKYVKGRYTLSGGSVGLFEGKKIGRAKNLEKLQNEIAKQRVIIDDLNAQIKTRQQEVITHNANLKEALIRDTEREIQQLNNQVYACRTSWRTCRTIRPWCSSAWKIWMYSWSNPKPRLRACARSLALLMKALVKKPASWKKPNVQYRAIEVQYNEIAAQYNTLNLQVTRQQSKIQSLKQELQFKTNATE